MKLKHSQPKRARFTRRYLHLEVKGYWDTLLPDGTRTWLKDPFGKSYVEIISVRPCHTLKQFKSELKRMVGTVEPGTRVVLTHRFVTARGKKITVEGRVK